jgi:hypothetical protein
VQPVARPFGRDTEDEPVRPHRVVHGETLAQELGIPGQLDLGPGGSQFAQQFGEPGRGAHRDRRLADHQGAARQMRRQRVDGGVHVRQVGGARPFELGGADADEMDVAELGRGGVGRAEAQPARLERLGKQFRQTGLEERKLTGAQPVDFVGIDVDAEHLVAEDGHTDRMRRAEVAGADDGEPGVHGRICYHERRFRHSRRMVFRSMYTRWSSSCR